MSDKKIHIAVSPVIAVLRLWRWRYVPDRAWAFIVAFFTGLLAGVGAFVLKQLVAHVSEFLTVHFHDAEANPGLLVIPCLGIVLTGIVCRYLMRTDVAHGCEQMMDAIRCHRYMLPPKLMAYPILASTLTLGFGGSAGSEGPIAYTGGAIGSNMARWCRLSPQMIGVMLGCGAGAGIAGIFKAPIGGALFTIEVLRMPLSTVNVMMLFVAVVTAAMTAYSLSGFTLDIPIADMTGFVPDYLPWVLALGVFCGFYSLYYSYVMKALGRRLERMRNPWVKNVAGGLILSVCVFLFPTLYGEGYGTIGLLINGHTDSLLNDSLWYSGDGGAWVFVLVAAGTLLAKCFACSATNNSGGVAGDFAPTLFAGSMAGFVFAMIANMLFSLNLPVAFFAYFGMAGVMSGAIRAPLMAMFLTCEMAAGYTLFLPLVITSTISFGIVRLFTADSYFTRFLDRPNGLWHWFRSHL